MLWTFQYRPKTIDDCIIPKETKKQMNEIVASGDIPNMLFVGRPGIGKTTVAMALCDQLQTDVLFINASKDNGIDMVRSRVEQFASTVSLTGGKKVVIFDESDGLSSQAQDSLKGVIEQFAKTCSFIFTANNLYKVIPALQSRLRTYSFSVPQEEKKSLVIGMSKRAFAILENEKVKFDKQAVASLINKNFPDFRKSIDELQRFSMSGEIDESILTNLQTSSVESLVNAMKEKNFGECRKWAANNASELVFRDLYKALDGVLEPSCIPEIILTIGEYQYRSNNGADPEINIAAFCVEFMKKAKFK